MDLGVTSRVSSANLSAVNTVVTFQVCIANLAVVGISFKPNAGSDITPTRAPLGRYHLHAC